MDGGKTWQPWQYFAKVASNCNTFGIDPEQRILSDSSVICTNEYTDIIPPVDGEVKNVEKLKIIKKLKKIKIRIKIKKKIKIIKKIKIKLKKIKKKIGRAK